MSQSSTVNNLIENFDAKYIDSPNKFDKACRMKEIIDEHYRASRTIVFTTCKHQAHFSCVANIPDTESKVYMDNEFPCPLCRNAFNIIIPNLHKMDKIMKKDMVEEIGAEVSHSEVIDLLLNRGHINSQSTTVDSLKELIDQNPDFVFSMLDQLMIQSAECSEIYTQSTKKKLVEDNSLNLLAKSVGYLIQMTELIGFDKFLEKYAIYYNNLYKCLRLRVIDEFVQNDITMFIKELEVSQRKLAVLIQIILGEDELAVEYIDLEDVLVKGLIYISMSIVDDHLMLSYSKAFIQFILDVKIKQREIRSKDNTRASESETFYTSILTKGVAFLVLADYKTIIEDKHRVQALLEFETEYEPIKKDELLLSIVGCSINPESGEFGKLRESFLRISGGIFIYQLAGELPSKRLKVEDNTLTYLKRLFTKISEYGSNNNTQEVNSVLASSFSFWNYMKESFSLSLQFTMINLQENFFDCYQYYIYNNCSICGNRPKGKDFGVCLLCGEIMCMESCTKGLGNCILTPRKVWESL